MKISEITYLSDPVPDYCDAIRKAASQRALYNVLKEWEELAPDALKARPTPKEWEWFQEGLAKETKGKFAGTEWMKRFADVMLPMLLFRVSLIAQHYKAPWGTAWKQLENVKPDWWVKLREKRSPR